MITLMKEITNAKVFLTHRLLTPPLYTYSAAPARGLSFAYPLLIVYCNYRGIKCEKKIFILLKCHKKNNKIFGVSKDSVIFASVIIQM